MNIDLNKNKENKMELKEMIKVMQHFADGGEIKARLKIYKSMYDPWLECNEPEWNWEKFDYLAIEQKQKVTIEKWLCKDIENDFIIIESSNINACTPVKKIKLIESYEVEL